MGHGPVNVAVIGAGPRAVGILERIGANADLLPDQPLVIHLVDPHVPGAGRIWSHQESPLLLMNSRAADVTMFTDSSCTLEGDVRPGPSLAEWAEGIRNGDIPAPTAGTERLAEVAAIGRTTFPSRRVQALYLEWVFGHVSAGLPAGVRLRVHRRTAQSLERIPGTPGRPDSWRVGLEDGPDLEVDLVLATLGHAEGAPDPQHAALANFAHRHGGLYVPPAQARDANIAGIRPGTEVIVRGMGLGAVDLVALLTQGRGGRFLPDPSGEDPERLRYVPSGQEAVLHLGSRRGVPYHAKVRDEDVPTGPTDLVHLTPEAIGSLEDQDGHVDFLRDVVPLIAQEIRRAVPGIRLDIDGDAADDDRGWDVLGLLDDPLAGDFTDPDRADRDPDRLDADRLDADQEGARERTQHLIIDHIEEDLRRRTGEDVEDARALFQVLLRITGFLARHLPAERLDPASRSAYPHAWHSLFSFLCSGPPPHRLRQLLALERAGVVHFLGPQLKVEAEESDGLFHARAAGGVHVRSPYLIDAFLPTLSVVGADNPFLRGLGEDHGREATNAPGKLDVDVRARVIGADGAPVPGLWAAGPATSEMPLGAFSRPHSNAAVFRFNDAIARDLLEASGAISDGSVADAGDPSPERDVASPVGVHRVSVVGSGKIGTALARQAVRSGLEVHLHSSQDPEVLLRRVPGAVPHPAPVRQVDGGQASPELPSPVVILALPFHAVFDLDPESFRDTVVIDVTNPWGPEDQAVLARARETHGAERTGTQLISSHLHGSHVVKSLNHIGYHDVEDRARPGGAPDRIALALAGDDGSACQVAAELLDRLGFDPVLAGPLEHGHVLDPQGNVFGKLTDQRSLSDLIHQERSQVSAA
jgi:predicted dinucleotide-binding enzyme/uncharacterized NAD(P)/FAD-binding protein YdhS